MQLILAIFVGALVGLHVSTWGMYKDAPHEGFTWTTYFRSTILAMIIAPINNHFFGHDLTNFSNLFLLWASTYTVERLISEVYKTFIRNQDQSKYFIPMQLSVFGKPVESYGARLFFGLLYVLACLLISFLIYSLNKLYHSGTINIHPLLILLPCSAFGWVSAFGGAWKDAPLEGFETFKFFRSPSIAYGYAFIASLLTSNLLLIAMCSIGLTIASIETYKTFFFLDKPRGKFQGKPILYPEVNDFRKKFVPLYVCIWILVIAFFIIGLNQRIDHLYI